MSKILDSIPTPVKWILATGVTCVLLLFLWLFVTKGMNGIGDFFFWKAANKKQAAVQAQLDSIKPMQAALDKTLVELAKSKEALAAAKTRTDVAVEIFDNDKLTAKQQVKAFEDAVNAAPTITDPTGVTMSDLCARAKSSGGSPQVIAALCPPGN